MNYYLIEWNGKTFLVLAEDSRKAIEKWYESKNKEFDRDNLKRRFFADEYHIKKVSYESELIK